MKLKLYKKEGTYFSAKDQKDKPFTNFYIACNDNLIPVEVKYFPNEQLGNRDPGYSARFAVLSAFAEPLPEKEKKEEKVTSAPVQTDSQPMEELGDQPIPF